jgi:putative hydrolase of the HAD superfamily
MYEEWAEHRHFVLYDDVIETLRRLHRRGLRLGLISNSHRPLDSFQSHFDLDGLISVAVSSFELGLMKPHPTVFRRALDLMGVAADEAVMVGDSVTHDVEGAQQVGMRGVLIARGQNPPAPTADTPVIRTLHELPDVL